MAQQAFTTPVGTSLNPTALGFVCHAVVIDNYSNQWVFLPDVPKYVSPNSLNVVVSAPALTAATVTYAAPAGQNQPPVPTGAVQTTWLDTPQATQAGYTIAPAVAVQSVTDPLFYIPTQDFNRRLIVAGGGRERDYYLTQAGRTLLRDDFSHANLQWTVTGSGGAAAALDTAQYLDQASGQVVKMTSPAGAGSTCTLRRFLELPADQGTNTFPLLVVEVLFQPADSNWRDLQVFLRPDDSAFRFEAAMRYWFQQATVSQRLFQYLDVNGSFQSDGFGAYAIQPPNGNVGDPWHRIAFGLDYRQGSGGYCRYHISKFDDDTFKPATPPASHPVATASWRGLNVDITLTTDGASAAVTRVQAVLVSDLSNLFQL